jgi:hypothetical protein
VEPRPSLANATYASVRPDSLIPEATYEAAVTSTSDPTSDGDGGRGQYEVAVSGRNSEGGRLSEMDAAPLTMVSGFTPSLEPIDQLQASYASIRSFREDEQGMFTNSMNGTVLSPLPQHP